jgi:hypothetical protein
MRRTSLLMVAGLVLVTAGFAFSANLLDNPDNGIRVTNALGKMPLYFIENQGQLHEDVGYYIQGYDKTLYFTPQGVTFSLSGKANDAGAVQRWTVKLDFLGANPNAKPKGEESQQTIFSYFKGQPEDWHTNLPTFRRLVYSDLWPGIDLVYTGNINVLKYEFVVKPGADPSQIRLAYRGATSVSVKETGKLAVNTPIAGFEDAAPYAYQEINGQRVEVPMAYDLSGRNSGDIFEYGFRIGAYDPTRTLILDPASLIYCGYIGGSESDMGWGIAVDAEGCAYVTGETYSTQGSFPVLMGPDWTYNGSGDAFVAKVSANGSGFVYCGYIGGENWDCGYGIAVDDEGNAYVTGYTSSPNFPFINCPFPYMGSGDAFIVKVDASGAALVYSGCIGGSQYDEGHDIAVDADRFAYVTGRANSSPADGFPVLVGPSLAYSGNGDAFVCKIDPVCGGFVYCGYIGGTNSDEANGIAVDVMGNAYVTGSTASSQGMGFPVITGPDVTHNGGYDAFVAEVDVSGVFLIYCGYVGGTDTDLGHDIAVDVEQNAYIAGETYSDEIQEGFPVLVGPDLTYNASSWSDAFVAKVFAGGQGLAYCGYIGGDYKDFGFGIALDPGARAIVAGNTWSSEFQGFPVLAGPDLTFNGEVDAFVSRVTVDGSGLEYSGYIGGAQIEWAAAVAVDLVGNAYVTGEVISDQTTFPVLVGPVVTYNGNQDAFVAKIDCCVLRGDADGSGAINVADPTYLTNWIFFGGPNPPCFDEGDADGSGAINVADPTYLTNWIFFSGPAPPPCP